MSDHKIRVEVETGEKHRSFEHPTLESSWNLGGNIQTLQPNQIEVQQKQANEARIERKQKGHACTEIRVGWSGGGS